MRKLMMQMSVSLDCFVSDANGGNDWIFKTGDQESAAWKVNKVSEAGLIIMGRKSFEAMSPYWPTATGPFAAPMNSIPKAVFSKSGYKGIPAKADQSAAEASWSAAKIFDGDLAAEINTLKAAEGKPILAIGGAGFMRNLIVAGLIDEFFLAIHPVALGKGFPIFNGIDTTMYLKLTDTKVFPGGTVVHCYSK